MKITNQNETQLLRNFHTFCKRTTKYVIITPLKLCYCNKWISIVIVT